MMIYRFIYKSLIALILGIYLSGCSSDNNNDPDLNLPLELLTVSGITTDPTGSWLSGCVDEVDPVIEDRVFDFTFSGSTLTIVITFYASTDGSCTGGITATENYVASLTPGGAIAITGWDGAVAPTAQDNSGPLSDNETVTPLAATIVSAPASSGVSPGDILDIFFVIDDTVPSAPVMYEDVDYDSGSTLASDFPVYVKQ